MITKLIKEHNTVRLNQDFVIKAMNPSDEDTVIPANTVGTVVHIYELKDPNLIQYFTVEFNKGLTVDLDASQVTPVNERQALAQETLEEISAASKDAKFTESLKTVISNIYEMAKEERHKTQPYKDMFEASHKGLRGILDKANDAMMQVVFDTLDVLKEKDLMPPCTPDDFKDYNKIYYALLMLPMLFNQAYYDIDNIEGMSCSKDKQRALMCAFFEKLMKVNKNE